MRALPARTTRVNVARLASGYVACLLSVAPDVLHAQSYPNRPLRFVTGGGPDALARILGPKFTETWGQPVVIEERGGAGGMLSAEVVAKANPDGHTLLLATGTHTINPNFYKLSYDMARDFAPVSLLGTIPFVLTVHPSLPVKTVDDLIRLAKARPGALNYGSGGNGSPGHLIAEMFISRTGARMVHVPYKTVAGGVTALISDQVQVNFVVGPSAVPQITAGRIRPLAVTTPQRARVLPDLPTLAESGLAGFDAPAWNGVLVPAQTPGAVVTTLHQEIVRALKLPDVVERMTTLSFEPVGNSPREFGVFLNAELAKWAKVAKEAGARVE
ncbi:MAG: tripartite tricarboxylate transporter substrate binding protein [Proteobacteria bacterium]|nr:tripartite tricarboxylate transporter substrate binding protein [Burkholderiales bacterium]